MPIVTQCPQCGKRLKAPDDRVGKQAKCPDCKTGFTIEPVGEAAQAGEHRMSGPVVETPSVPVPTAVTPRPRVTAHSPAAAVAVAEPMWHVQTADGAHYGPVTKADLDGWASDDRFDADCQLLMDGWEQWKWAEEVYPHLTAAQGPVVDSAAIVPGEIAVFAGERNPYASPVAGGRATTIAQDIAPEDDGWIYARIGLLISQFSLIVGVVSALLLGIAMLTMEDIRPTRPSAAETAKVMAFILVIGMISYIGSYFTLLAGWAVCTGAPRKTRSQGLAIGALASVAGGLLFLIIFIPMSMPGGSDSPMTRDVMLWLYGICSGAGYAIFAFYLSTLGQTFGDRNLMPMAIVYVGIQALSLVWNTLTTFAFEAKTIPTKVEITVLMLLAMISSGFLVFMVFMANRHVSRVVRQRR